MPLRLTALLVLLITTSAGAGPPAPTGFTAWPRASAEDGPPGQPRLSLNEALAKAAALHGQWPVGAAGIMLQPGDYVLDEPLRIGAEHAYLLLAAKPGTVRLLGGKIIPPSALKPLADDDPLASRFPKAVRAHIRTADLKALGVKEIAPLVEAGFGRGRTSGHTQLYIDHKPMPIARYPNEGYLKIAKALDGRRMTTADPRPKAWATTKGAWAYGYWVHDWADSYEPVEAFDAKTGVITLGGRKGPVYGLKAGQRFCFLNVPEELDAPGEWIIDPKTGRLYAYPPAGSAGKEVAVSTLGEPMIIVKGRLERRHPGADVGDQPRRGNPDRGRRTQRRGRLHDPQSRIDGCDASGRPAARGPRLPSLPTRRRRHRRLRRRPRNAHAEQVLHSGLRHS